MKFQSNLIYRIIDKIVFLKFIVRKGGLTLKWVFIISAIVSLVVVLTSFIFTIMSERSLIKANDDLCKTIINNISSVESILTVEKTSFKRSLILQDMVSSISKSDLPGLEYVAVYDLRGKLSKHKRTYAAHSNGLKRGKWYSKKIYKEIEELTNFTKEKKIIEHKKNNYRIYQYRKPFKFFDTKVGVIEIVFLEESILEPIKKSRFYILISGLVMLLVGILITILVTRRMVYPIRSLSKGMLKVRKGNLDVELDIIRHDELGDLKEDFLNMVTHLKEKILMQKFVSDSTINMIKEKSGTGDLSVGGKKENYAFLFSDVRGFTAMSENMKPEEVVDILNTYLDLQAQIIRRNNGDIDKFVGDEVMAFFHGKDRSDNAIKAAVEIINSINDLNEERMERDEYVINVGIGLNNGEVVHGRIGSKDRMDNTSIGDTVNLAARLCSYAEAGTIIASKNIMKDASKGFVKGKKLDPIKVKGKAKPIEIYTISGVKK